MNICVVLMPHCHRTECYLALLIVLSPVWFTVLLNELQTVMCEDVILNQTELLLAITRLHEARPWMESRQSLIMGFMHSGWGNWWWSSENCQYEITSFLVSTGGYMTSSRAWMTGIQTTKRNEWYGNECQQNNTDGSTITASSMQWFRVESQPTRWTTQRVTRIFPETNDNHSDFSFL